MLKNKGKRKGVFENPTPSPNPDFNFKDLSTMKNHWLKFEGKRDSKKRMKKICTVFFPDGERLRCNFRKGVANGKGVFYDKHNKKTVGEWKNNKFIDL